VCLVLGFADIEVEQVGVNIGVNKVEHIDNCEVPDKLVPLITIKVAEVTKVQVTILILRALGSSISAAVIKVLLIIIIDFITEICNQRKNYGHFPIGFIVKLPKTW